MALWRLYYHFVWATKARESLISEAREPALHHYIIGKADALKCIVHAINGTANHIHLVASVPPTLSISDFVKNIKGSSAHYVNHNLSATPEYFGWQAGYGVFSLGRKQLDQAIEYVQNQKIHHAQGTTIISLEQTANDEDAPKRCHLPGNQFPGS
ncbi:transposase [Leptolyngbyaceae cyanobacterium JSC-12]|nr:transposase [Leptolyngbyaceae cyanobacterium JSC-12]